MKDQKKILLILIALALSVATVFCLGSCLGGTSSSVNGGGTGDSSSGGENGGDAFVPTELKLEYKQVAGGVEIYGVGKDSLKTELIIPATIDTYPVVGIAENAFRGFSNIEHVTFEEGCRIKYIGTRAFDGCSSLESFVIPDTVESLGTYTFASCPKLEYLFVPISVETAGEYIVRGCDTAKLDVICAAGSKPSGWDSYYASNKNYDSGKHFEFWWGIERMEMSNPDLECCVNLDGELVMTDYYGKDINVTIPDTVADLPLKHIYARAFASNTNIRSVTLPETLKSIGDEVFKGCTALRYLSFPNGLKSIGKRALQNCSALDYVTIPNSVDSVGDFVFIGCDTAKLDVYCEIPTKPSSWSGYYASNNTNSSGTHFMIWWGTGAVEYSDESFKAGIKNDGTLIITHHLGNGTSVTIPSEINGKTVTELGNSSFSGGNNTNLRTIILPDTLVTVGNEVFKGCTALKTLEFPESVKSIGKRAFQNCSALEYVTIPNSVDSVGDFAFIGCNAEKLDVYCEIPTKPSTWSSYYASNNTNSSGTHFDIWWGTGAVEYSNENYKMGIKNDGTLIITHYLGKESAVEIPTAINGKNVTEIGSYAFYECSTVQTISIPNTVTHIREYAFAKCISLTEVRIPTSVVHVGKRAFSSNGALTKVYVPASVTEFGDFMFIGCNTNNLTVYCEASGKPSTWSSYYASNNTNSSGTHFTIVWSGYTP